ncbi:MAG: SGNH/GDSL hydrolase family protein [Verrucomicrobiia bacterium]
MRNLLLTMTIAVAFAATAAENPSAAFIQRTMKALEASTAENPAHVRVLFYGQSITAQRWTEIVQKQLEKRYPTVKFEFRNAAIGGYVSSVLIRTADHDLYPWYPDLLFFHVYGPMDKYEEIVKRVRERTSAEIVIWTSHLNIVSKDKPDQINTSHDDRAVLIRAVAPKYDCMLIDLREKWRRHLAANGIAVKDMLSDTVHLNPKGLDLYAKLIGEELVRAPKLGDNPTAAGTITTFAAGGPEVTRGPGGQLTLRFTGNRALAVSDGKGVAGAKATVLLDGKPLDGMKELWAISRPSVGPAKIWMPAINNIAFEQPLVEEDWTLTCLPDSTPDGKKIHFKVQGSVTGEDGEGWNKERFVSRSRRVVIEPSDWQIGWTLGYKKATLPEGFKVTWRSYPLFARVYEPAPAGTRTLLVQGCTNRSHTLTLIPEGGSLGIGSFVVHAPPSRFAADKDAHKSK